VWINSSAQQTLQIDPDPGGCLWVQLSALIDEGCRFTGPGHRPQRRQEGGETAAGAATHDLYQLALGEPAAEQVVETVERGR